MRPATRSSPAPDSDPSGFDDPMRITGWERPARCEMTHLGRVVRGGGVFLVEAREGGSRCTWVEWVDPPLGLVGQLGLRAGRRPTQRVLRVALRRFARWVEAETLESLRRLSDR